jgi:hypothetical protein
LIFGATNYTTKIGKLLSSPLIRTFVHANLNKTYGLPAV